MPAERLGFPLAGSLLPWIDRDLGNGYSREEFKAGAEGNKILGLASAPVPIDGLCVRIGAMRCHSQARDDQVEAPDEDRGCRARASPPRTSGCASCRTSARPRSRALTPAAVTGTLDIAVGRIRHLAMGEDYVTAFTVGDQLLWGAAEPLRRMLRLLVGR